ncbi:MAG: tRNA lysidine(34) synthetase TilS [Pseudomonadota bacterium]
MTFADPSEAVAAAVSDLRDRALGVAVSGGGDSVALLSLLAEQAAGYGVTLHAATVDHRLRPESTSETAMVAAHCARLGVPHSVLPWVHQHGAGNLQQAAREARQTLLIDWARERGIADVFLGHTADDQAETLVMRLARGSGVQGLSGMRPRTEIGGMIWHRPLLRCTRVALRQVLTRRGLAWVDDPSNADLRFDRVRVREAMPALEALGLSVSRLLDTAENLDRAAEVVRAQVLSTASVMVRALPAGCIRIDRPGLLRALPEVRLRLLAEALSWVAAARHTPRLSALREVENCLTDPPGRRTLHGCVVMIRRDSIWVVREAARLGPSVPAGQVWDGRWSTSASGPDVHVGALGEEGIRQIADWRAHGLPRDALAVSPAFWKGAALIAAPFANLGKDCHVKLRSEPVNFFMGLGLR